jgi:hypothetical protein
MQHDEHMKAESLALSLDDGGTSDNEAAYNGGTGVVSPLEFFSL